MILPEEEAVARVPEPTERHSSTNLKRVLSALRDLAAFGLRALKKHPRTTASSMFAAATVLETTAGRSSFFVLALGMRAACLQRSNELSPKELSKRCSLQTDGLAQGSVGPAPPLSADVVITTGKSWSQKISHNGRLGNEVIPDEREENSLGGLLVVDFEVVSCPSGEDDAGGE